MAFTPFVDLFPSFTRQTALLAAAIFLALLIVRRVPVLRMLLSAALTTAIILLLLVIVRREAALDPTLGRIAQRLGFDEQRVAGRETCIPISPDGHFWARARIDGVPRRMLIDSGATVTALSPETAAAAGIATEQGIVPVILRTANGSVAARTGRVREFRLGNIVARDLAVVIATGFGETDVLGMNFLSRLKSWRVENRTLILSPNHPVGEPPGATDGSLRNPNPAKLANEGHSRQAGRDRLRRPSVPATSRAMRVALFEPEIAGNVGAVLRLGACLGVAVDLIEPMGFEWDDRRVRRAAMDYIDHVAIARHADFDRFRATVGSARLVLLTPQGGQSAYDFAFEADDVLLFGKESSGVPREVADACAGRVRLPMRPHLRSMNLAMSAAIALGEALRRTGTLPD